ncbi:inactive pancreatic lipase-related protein 1-like [Dreissena polymorpha]|uniref:Lipase domain-containing protein n=1 Tax=Dreissena polymorpha TaxID=45954 RepID=A0A9D4E5G0_DREPO|nr:inactive pancreatic lipase-related protein 1-like [Dreissena polymorpha]KAH3772676.1 hypothetical protein DPMN_174018 [Dreissena polymorpha]
MALGRGLLTFLTLLNCSHGFLLVNEVCYTQDGLGCFSKTSPYDNAQGFLPESPATIGVQFRLFTRSNPVHYQLVDKSPSTILHSNFNPTRKTKVITHGYIDSANATWVKFMVLAILRQEDANVIAVDWSPGAARVNYLMAAANTRVVGALIAQLLTQLHITAHAQYIDFHLIGHSLGAHISGYAGQRVPGLGRITGLDPAGPAFENTAESVRLDPTDALFVEAIHTDGDSLIHLGFGLKQRVGHVDFYPNGGDDQPGCPANLGQHLFSLLSGSIEYFSSTLACSHVRATDLYTESISSSCHFRSQPCDSVANYEAGRCSACNSGCVAMGYTTPSAARGSYFLTTNRQPPFCRP